MIAVSTHHIHGIEAIMSRRRMLPRSIAALTLAFLAIAGQLRAQEKFSFETTPGQLPKDAIPQHYALTLRPNIESLTFDGTVAIDFELKKATRAITLNAAELKISRGQLDGAAGVTGTVTADEANETATITFAREVTPGKHRLDLTFSGKIDQRPQGLYHIKYQTNAGQKTMLATQMEPTDARRMFPCWDEPVYRATFEITVVVPQKLKAMSNMPIARETDLGDGNVEIRFGRTPSMASYLVVLAVGEFEWIRDECDGTELRIITTEGKKETGRYALEITKKLLAYYNDYFGVKFPLPKLDSIALPGGFGGAMENWGGITYNEAVLLFDPQNSSQRTKELIFNVVAHEMAHQWFGDLVTTAWWDNLWLNEGFASWMAAKASDHFNPDWNVWVRENGSKNGAMSSDARKTTHPIRQTVTNPAEANRVFDEITYAKGQAILRMLESYLGENVFRDGIRRYMAQHKYSSATTADLWQSLGEAANKRVSDVTAGWVDQPGFPLIKVSATTNAGRRMLTLEQERFTVNYTSDKPIQWQVPVTYARIGADGAVKNALLEAKTATIDAGSGDQPIKLNTGDIGYYRVKYDPALFDQLKHAAPKLGVSDLMNLLSDTWALVEAGQLASTEYLDIASAVASDSNPAVWENIANRFASIDDLLVDEPVRASFQEFGRTLLGRAFAQLGWEPKPDESDVARLLRGRLITILGRLNDNAVAAECRKRFDAFVTDPATLSPDLRPAVTGVAGRHADKRAYDALHTLGRNAQGAEQKQMYYGAMFAAQDVQLARESLSIVLSDELPTMLAPFGVYLVASSGEHRALAWDFAREHMTQLQGKLSSLGKNMYAPMLMSVFSDLERANELEAYAKLHLPAEAEPDVAKQAESIRSRANLKQRELPYIKEWLDKHTSSE
jgi:aminopeptidase N